MKLKIVKWIIMRLVEWLNDEQFEQLYIWFTDADDDIEEEEVKND